MLVYRSVSETLPRNENDSLSVSALHQTFLLESNGFFHHSGQIPSQFPILAKPPFGGIPWTVWWRRNLSIFLDWQLFYTERLDLLEVLGKKKYIPPNGRF